MNGTRHDGSSGLSKLGILCGVLAPLLWASVIVLCGALRPGFSHFAQCSVVFRRTRNLKNLAAYSAVSGVLGLAFLLLMLWSAEHGTARGLFERLSSGVLSLWILVLALRLARR